MPGADVVYDLTGGDFVERSWRCTAHGGRYLAVGFADDDANGMTGRPLRMACIGNIDIVAVMVAWADTVDPGMRRFGFNPFGRDVADEIHADLLRLAAAGRSVPPSGGGSPWRRPAGHSTSTRPGGRWGGPWWRSGEHASTTSWRDSELRSRPLRALNWTGAKVARLGPRAPLARPSSVTAAAAKAAGSRRLRQRLLPGAAGGATSAPARRRPS